MPANDNTVLMEGVRIIFRNFSGKEGQYNREGDRNFAVLLDEQIAIAMAEDGWNVKFLRPRTDVDEEAEVEAPQAYLPVSVNFKGRPPRIVLITSRGRTNLDEGSIEMLDWADILNVDLIVRPYEWTVNGKSGIKAYLQSIYVTIEEDALEIKYNELNPA
jgi:hypothetical protein